ncbi:MAG: hypothetical protein GX299_01850 [Epulopiscium sp.]|jgi:hypothetical protein|nr:hypothetical protein [Candidatus Epulonipiscium sp.]
MKAFTVGLLAGGTMAAMGIGYLMQDKKARNTVLDKGKKAAVKTSEMVDDVVDSILEL